MFCCLGSKKRQRYSPENRSSEGQADQTNPDDKSLRNGSVSISAPIHLPAPNPDDPVYVNGSIEELTKLCAKQTQDNNNYQVNSACTDSEEQETQPTNSEDIKETQPVNVGDTETVPEESLAKELKETQKQVAELLSEAETMSQDMLINAVSRLENVASRLENLARSQPASRTSSTTGDAEVTAPFVVAFDAILNGPIASYMSTSASIGGDVKTQSEMVQAALQAQRQFLAVASQCKSPPEVTLMELLKPTSDKIAAVQEFREHKRTSPQFNHLSAVSESLPALGWVTVAYDGRVKIPRKQVPKEPVSNGSSHYNHPKSSPTPGPFVKEMSDAGMFYSNRVLKEFKEKDPQHAEWTKSWNKALSDLQAYIKQYHTTGVSWNPQGGNASAASTAPKGGAPPPPPPGPPPPPPPPAVDDTAAASGGNERAALFASLNQGTDITKGLKKVSDDMKTHKNPALRQGPAPFKAAGPPKPAPKPEAKVAPAVTKKPPLTQLQDKKWIVEYHDNNKNIVIDKTETKQVVMIYKCTGSTIQVKGKVNSILLDSCKKTAVVFEDVLSSIEFVNCQSVQGQVTGRVNTVSIDKTDGCMMYLSKDSISAEIVTAKSSELNILVPGEDGDYKEYPLPEQFKSTWNGKKFVTVPTESV